MGQPPPSVYKQAFAMKTGHFNERACPIGPRGMKVVVLALALLASARAQDKRAETESVMSLAPAPFVMGSRYGRSPAPARVMMPRNDRFFIGSRYGKRGGGVPGPLGSLIGPPTSLSGLPDPHSSHTRPTTLVCNYTGVYSLYQCRPAPFRGVNRRPDSDSNPDED